MNTQQIEKRVEQLIRKHRTRNPFAIANAENITVMPRDDLTRQKGAVFFLMRNCFIIINDHLSDEMKRIVCAHELGHAVLHREDSTRRMPIWEFELFDIKNQLEYDANTFAADLLLDEDEILEQVASGRTVVQIARSMHTNANLLLLKLNDMRKRGYQIREQEMPTRGFLGTITD